MASSLQELSQKYRKYVTENVDVVGHVETACRVLSYVIAGRFENGAVLSELLYSASNLLVLLNDSIIRKAAGIRLQSPETQHRLLHWLTILDYVEVFLELGAGQLWGPLGRWVVVVCVQVAKAGLRLFLVKRHKIGVQPSPPVQTLNREKQLKKVQNGIPKEKQDNKMVQMAKYDALLEVQNGEKVEATFTLKSTGRAVRSLSAAPPLSQRDWKLPHEEDSETDTQMNKQKGETVYDCPPTKLSRTQIKAELLHITRPLAHLAGVFLCGEESWKPWLVACGFDVSSLWLMGEPSDFNLVEQQELKRRAVYLLLYLLRSPFYDKYTKAKAYMLLYILANYIPGMSLIAKPVMEYLPVWQKIYAYVWAM